jgi:hypothetical protein
MEVSGSEQVYETAPPPEADDTNRHGQREARVKFGRTAPAALLLAAGLDRSGVNLPLTRLLLSRNPNAYRFRWFRDFRAPMKIFLRLASGC